MNEDEGIYDIFGGKLLQTLLDVQLESRLWEISRYCHDDFPSRAISISRRIIKRHNKYEMPLLLYRQRRKNTSCIDEREVLIDYYERILVRLRQIVDR